MVQPHQPPARAPIRTQALVHPSASPARWRVALGSSLLLGLLWLWPDAAHAEKPEWAGGGKKAQHGSAAQAHPGGQDRSWQQHAGPQVQAGGTRIDIRIGGYFGEPQRIAVHQGYAQQFGVGGCPPGLAKKGQGCLPPGQAKKAYRVGQPLASGVVYHDLPPSISVRLGTPPAGHRFVRVAADILLIAVGTGMVIDAIEDLGR